MVGVWSELSSGRHLIATGTRTAPRLVRAQTATAAREGPGGGHGAGRRRGTVRGGASSRGWTGSGAGMGSGGSREDLAGMRLASRLAAVPTVKVLAALHIGDG
eukprot:scaffold2092_cov137-Isochrysis_galbana.AAC.5